MHYAANEFLIFFLRVSTVVELRSRKEEYNNWRVRLQKVQCFELKTGKKQNKTDIKIQQLRLGSERS